jgi:oxygen-dependent protoporphyrinogen oxidase
VSGKVRLLAEPLTRRGQETERIEDLFVRKFGREAYERFIGPLYGGIYGSDPAAMPAAFALRELLERERETKSMLRSFRQRVTSSHTAPPISFTEGNQQLPRALTAEYSDRIELSTPVTGIYPGDKYRVETERSSELVDRGVITSGASPTAKLLEPLADAGFVSGLHGLRELQYNPLIQVFLQADHDYAGKGYQVGFDEEMHTLGSSWNANMFDRDGVQTVFLGGMHEPELVKKSDDELDTIACQEFEQVVNTDARCLGVSRLEPGFPAWDTSWWDLEALTLPDGITLETNYTNRMGIPSRIREARELAESFASEGTSVEETERTSTRSTIT